MNTWEEHSDECEECEVDEVRFVCDEFPEGLDLREIPLHVTGLEEARRHAFEVCGGESFELRA